MQPYSGSNDSPLCISYLYALLKSLKQVQAQLTSISSSIKERSYPHGRSFQLSLCHVTNAYKAHPQTTHMQTTHGYQLSNLIYHWPYTLYKHTLQQFNNVCLIKFQSKSRDKSQRRTNSHYGIFHQYFRLLGDLCSRYDQHIYYLLECIRKLGRLVFAKRRCNQNVHLFM